MPHQAVLTVAIGVLIIGIVWGVSKANAPVAAFLAFVLAVACPGALRLFALCALVLTVMDLVSARSPKPDRNLVPCANCGRLLSPSSTICPRCEHRVVLHEDESEGPANTA